MTYHFPPEVDQLLRKQLDTGVYASPDEVLLEALRSLDREREDWRAIQEGLATLEQGDQGVFLEEAFEIVRTRHNIPHDV